MFKKLAQKSNVVEHIKKGFCFYFFYFFIKNVKSLFVTRLCVRNLVLAIT